MNVSVRPAWTGYAVVLACLRRWMMESARDVCAIPSFAKVRRSWMRVGAGLSRLLLAKRGARVLIESVMVIWDMSGGSIASPSRKAQKRPYM